MTDFDGVLAHKIPIHAAIGDSQGALFGQGCLQPGQTKTTYGTGSSIMMNAGDKVVKCKQVIVNSVGWRRASKVTYVLEGNINYSAGVISWLKDDLKLISDPKETKDLAEKAEISIATITKMGTVGSHVNTNVLERICVALNCKLDDIIEIVQVSDGEMMSEESAYSESDCLELNPIACKEYGLTRTEQEIVHFIYEQLQYYRDNPPSFMVNQARSDFGSGSYEEAKKSIPTDRFYSLVLNEVIENWGQEGCDFAQKHIPFKTIESGYFEPEDETFGELTMI